MLLSQMFDTCNQLVKTFRTVKERISANDQSDLRLKLIKKRNTDARLFNLPTASEIATLVVGDFQICQVERDIIIEHRQHGLQRIDKLHPLYLPM